VYPCQPIPEALQRLAALQAHVITREQALGTGFGRHGVDRLVGSGAWQRLASGLYFSAPVTPPWESLAWAGVLLGGDDARLGGPTAGHLHGLIAAAPSEIDVLVPVAAGCPRVAGPWVFRRERPGARLPRTIGSPPRLSLEDTVLDLAAGTRDPRRVVEWVTAAVQSRHTNAERLLAALRRRRAVPHRQLLIKLLDDVAVGARSVLEVDYLRNVERPHGLPVGVRQASRRNTEVDVWYDEYQLLLELDGRRGHTGTDRFRDMHRDNRATTDGLATLRYGSYDVHGSPCEVAAQVGNNLALRGWPGPFLYCDRCRRAA
jgi:very-short-patch-repair endonuclease